MFQHGADLELLDLATNKTHVVDVRIPGDQGELRPRSVDVSRFMTGWSISPSGKHVAMEARGDIWTAPVKEGTPRNLTHTSGIAERDPAWSPDGRWIAYLSDATGEYELYIMQSDGKGETRQLTKNGGAFRTGVQLVARLQIHHLRRQNRRAVPVTIAQRADETGRHRPQRQYDHAHTGRRTAAGSPMRGATGRRSERPRSYLTTSKPARPPQVTSGMFSDSDPVFDHKGDYLYFASARSFNPQYGDEGSTWIYSGTQFWSPCRCAKTFARPTCPNRKRSRSPTARKQA